VKTLSPLTLADKRTELKIRIAPTDRLKSSGRNFSLKGLNQILSEGK